MKESLVLTSIHPFTPRQAEVLGHILGGVSGEREIAGRMGISPSTVKNYLGGTGGRTLTGEGIFGIVQRLTGRRPSSTQNLVARLYGDVILKT